MIRLDQQFRGAQASRDFRQRSHHPQSLVDIIASYGTAVPPKGNMPRYPLVIAEVDEKIPALKKNTVTVIDHRQPDQDPDIQFSNFSLLENRETHALELYLTTYGEDATNVFTADNYKYTLTLK